MNALIFFIKYLGCLFPKYLSQYFIAEMNLGATLFKDACS